MIQIELAEHELRVVVAGVGFQLRPRMRDAACGVTLKCRNEGSAALALLERLFLVWRVANQPLELKEERRGSQLVDFETVGLGADEIERQRGRLVVRPVVEERLCIFERCPVRDRSSIFLSLSGTRIRSERLKCQKKSEKDEGNGSSIARRVLDEFG
jgi:hypothetical protein